MPPPPSVDVTGFERLVVDQIETNRAAVVAAPRSGAAWGRLGMVLHAHDLREQAQQCYEQAEHFEPREPRWPYLRGILIAQENPERAIPELQAAVRLSGRDADAAALRLAETFFETGRFDDAERVYRQLQSAGHDHARTRLGLARVGQVRRRPEEARRWLDSALRDPHTARAAHSLLAALEQAASRPAAAEQAANTIATLRPDQPWPDPFSLELVPHRIGRRLWAVDAQRLLDQGRVAEAEPILNRLVADYPTAPEGWLMLGRLRFERGDCTGAEAALRRHLQLEPRSVNGQAQLGAALLCLERYPEAIAALEQATRLKPDLGEAYFNLGYAQTRARRGLEAIGSLRSAIRYSPHLVDAYIILADLLNQTGEKQEALQLLQRAQRLKPTDERIQVLLQRVKR